MNRLQKIQKISAEVRRLERWRDASGPHHRSVSSDERMRIQYLIDQALVQYRLIYNDKH